MSLTDWDLNWSRGAGGPGRGGAPPHRHGQPGTYHLGGGASGADLPGGWVPPGLHGARSSGCPAHLGLQRLRGRLAGRRDRGRAPPNGSEGRRSSGDPQAVERRGLEGQEVSRESWSAPLSSGTLVSLECMGRAGGAVGGKTMRRLTWKGSV